MPNLTYRKKGKWSGHLETIGHNTNFSKVCSIIQETHVFTVFDGNIDKIHTKNTINLLWGKHAPLTVKQILAVLFFNFLGIASFVDVLPPPLSVSDICYITVQNTPESGGVLFLGISKYLCQNPCKRLSAHSIVKCLSGAYLISRMEPISMRS